jgi:uncharacterized protein involved in exopolysaccharide biosynthesis
MLSALRSETGIGSVEAEYSRLEDEKANIESLRNTLARDLAGTKAKCESLKLAVTAAEEVILTERSEGISNAATDGIRQQLYEIELAEGKASRTYTEDHPDLKRIRAQLAVLRERFAAEEADRTEFTYGRNPGREALQLECEQEQTRAAELAAQLQAADLQGEQVLASIRNLNETSNELNQLVLDVAFLERSYDTYSDSLEQSRIGSSITQQQISNVNIAQPATYSSEPIGPNRMMLAVGGLLVAILGAIPLALVMEHLDHRLKSPAEAEAFTELPVLVALPRESRPVQIPELAKGSQK